ELNQKQPPKLPRRGKKSTITCNNHTDEIHLLETSRDALHRAISQERKTISRNLCHAIWHGAPINQGLLTKVQHQDFHRDIGHTSTSLSKSTSIDPTAKKEKAKDGKIWLWPEEVLWLMERGVLMLQYCEAPVSLQQAPLFSLFDRFRDNPNNDNKIHNTDYNDVMCRRPLVEPGTCSTLEEVFENLQIIQRIDDDDEMYRNQSNDDKNDYTIDYYVYASGTKFKKKQPGEPTFRVCVASAKSKTPPAFHDFSKIFHESNERSNIMFAIVEDANIVFISRQEVNFHELNVKIIGVNC
ncbi:13080_t:CDS:2, partial [Ambispora leptoticha]